MKLTGTYNGKPIELELTEEQVEVLEQAEKKKTGWERVEKGERYFINAIRVAQEEMETGSSADNTRYEHASYFANETLVKNILTAQFLQRKLWRRSAELCENMDWNNPDKDKWYIWYDCEQKEISLGISLEGYEFGQVYFDTKEHAEQVIEEFKDELIWYFTEFQSRMD